MAEALLNQVSTNEARLEDLLEWLTHENPHEEEFARLSSRYKCTRTEFIGYFLNFVHEEIGSWTNERKSELEETKSSNEVNRSQSFPLDLSTDIENVSNSTPKVVKVSSDTSVLSYMSPVSPIYKNTSFTTPKNKLCLGDFIINKKVSSRKKNSEARRRIKPTNLSQSKVSSFHKSENSFSFNKSELEECPIERNILVEEKLRILSRSLTPSLTGSPQKPTKASFSGEVQADPQLVTNTQQIDPVVQIYVSLLDQGFILNLTNEIHFLVALLLKKQYYCVDWGIAPLNDHPTLCDLFKNVHNVVYFACKILQRQSRVLRNYDNATIRLLSENPRIQTFAPSLVYELQKVSKSDRVVATETSQNNICFNSDTDNRQNFPTDVTFHAFRKQRDLFYEILRLWESHHLAPGFDFGVSLGGKIKSLLSLSSEATNFVHLARLFKAQLLTCRHGDDFFTSLEIDEQKLNRLKSRCVTKTNCQGLNSLPDFSEKEEFYKDFIVAGASYVFNRHLSDVLIEEIAELNENNFGSNTLEEDGGLESVPKKSYYATIKNLRTLAKFLAFVESLPYKHDAVHYSDNLLGTHLKIREQLKPNFDVRTLLEDSIERKSVILCVPWLIKYLSMLDFVTLRLPYYVQVQKILFWIYRNFDWAPDSSVYLIKFSLGWLFDLPNFSYQDYLNFRDGGGMDRNGWSSTPKFCLDSLDVVDQDVLYFCCPFLDEIKKLLEATLTSRPVSIKHITPVTALQSPDAVARRKVEQQLEEAFFNGQPISLRKTVEFVSERIASTCVKHICHTLVPAHKKLALEKLKSRLKLDDDADLESQKATMRAKANRLAMTCLEDLQRACDEEVRTISQPKIEKAIESLVSLDILPQTKQVCVEITKKSCHERVKQWIDSHVILSVFNKDFNDEIQRITHGESKSKRPVFMLPSGGTNPKHNDDTTSAAHLLEDYRFLTIEVIEKKMVSKEAVTSLLDATTKSIDERGDVNQCILATICTQILDLVILLMAHDWRLLSDDVILSKSCSIWRLYYNGCDDLFKSLLSPRNVTIFSQSRDVRATWDTFARFIAYLMKNGLLTCQVLESQCTGIFRTDWDQNTLKLISDFFKTFGGLYRSQGGCPADLAFLLGFFSDYCEDLF